MRWKFGTFFSLSGSDDIRNEKFFMAFKFSKIKFLTPITYLSNDIENRNWNEDNNENRS